MEYVINQSGNRVVLDLLANATKSLVGLAVNNCRIISIPYSELYAMVLSVYGVKGEWVFCREAFKYRTTPLSDAEDDSVIVLESVEVEGFRDTIASDYTILEALKLYQSSDIFLVTLYHIASRMVKSNMVEGGKPSCGNTELTGQRSHTKLLTMLALISMHGSMSIEISSFLGIIMQNFAR